jgi:zinc transport system substrate-binding protein
LPARRQIRRAVSSGALPLAIALLITGLLASSCATGGAPGGSDGGNDGSRSVVTAFYPLQEAAERVGGDRVVVTNLTPAGVEPHDLELTPQAVADIQSADVVFYLGDGFQPAVADAAEGAEGVAVDLLAELPTVDLPEGVAEPGLSVDPHVWLDPSLYAEMVAGVEQALAQADPSAASAYRSNAASFTRELGRLGNAFEAGLARCERTVIVTSHAAFGYLAAAYGLSQESISGLAPDAEPSAERLASLKDLVQREGVTTVFTEDLVSPKVAETLATEAGVTTAVLHTVEGLTAEQQAVGADYGSLMRQNLQRLRVALGCS